MNKNNFTKNQNNCKNCILSKPNCATGIPCHFKITNEQEILTVITTKEAYFDLEIFT